jgi:arylsulfatase A-like enzyme
LYLGFKKQEVKMTTRHDSIPRTVLPIPHRPYQGTILYDAKDPEAKFPPIKPFRPPEGSPNVLIILLDDVGFGASSAFGGPCNTPTAERLSAGGLKYTRFHTTALCSPTRAALLTGRNHHTVGMGGITEMATSLPGSTSSIPNSAASIAKVLKYNGYSTAQFGKCHEVPVWETSPIGPFDHWPTGNGFEKFYGFVAGENNQWYPEIYDGITPVPTSDDPNYHFMADMADQAIQWVTTQKSLAPDKPFFIYFAPGATHAPHHVPKEWADKYRGKFDDGWDKLREGIFARQKELGVIPSEAQLTKRPAEIPSWEKMAEELKPILRRQMEVYAGFFEYTDYHIGRLVEAIEKLGALENTLVYYIIGDNGASAEGGINGTFSEMLHFNNMQDLETTEYLIQRLDDLGGHHSYNHYAVGWAHAMDTPYQWTKQIASHFGGTRNGTVVHWPKGIQARGEVRGQFHHVIDVVPTILEAAGLPEPISVDGVQQKPLEGVSMIYSFDNAAAADRHELQYFEMFGNRGIYYKGWTAVTRHGLPWVQVQPPAFDDDDWELYDTTKDWTQAENLARQYPEKLHELQRLWLIEAVRHNVLPLDDRRGERFRPSISGRPRLYQGRSQRLLPGTALNVHSAISIKNRTHFVTADVEVDEGAARGVIIAEGANFGGWGLYAKDGKLTYVYNCAGMESFMVQDPSPLTTGNHTIRMEFAYDGGGLGRGGNVSLFVDSKKVAEGRVEHTVPVAFAGDARMMVGNKTGGPICSDFKVSGNPFSGRVNWVQIYLAPARSDQMVSTEQQVKLALGTQ